VWQAVMHIVPSGKQVAAPDVGKLAIGRSLVASLTAQIYQIAALAEQITGKNKTEAASLQANFVASNLPLPLFVLNAEQTIIFANSSAATYLGRESQDIIGQNVYSILNMLFPNEETFSVWFDKVRSTAVTASSYWERVRIEVSDNQPMRMFDLAAYYNKGNSTGYETMLVMFDHTKTYSQDDQAVSLIALGMHELRTPLALLRGYIEAFDEELTGKLSPELDGFMSKMKATAQQLNAFVNNILNVARVDNDQMPLKLHEENWPVVLKEAVDMMSLRAQVRGITLKLNVADGLPTVGADRVSMQEVVANLIDNAIKYSGQSKEILIDAHMNAEGYVETTVQDKGVGVPASIMPNLFTKFYRDHRNRAQIGGTGLGLYLCKAFVSAHGGNIWVKSREGQGSTFGFTLVPFAHLADEIKNNANQEITRSAHGWIKNHSLYRR
ncbi:MAG TPA: PAS domain-containing sensor histidine kinase, partial [Verrucomicrobiae bacterium]|nr:PAS domain-containing sensor histidine kinase [Verrucomicrobiae bacterium]